MLHIRYRNEKCALNYALAGANPFSADYSCLESEDSIMVAPGQLTLNENPTRRIADAGYGSSVAGSVERG